MGFLSLLGYLRRNQSMRFSLWACELHYACQFSKFCVRNVDIRNILVQGHIVLCRLAAFTNPKRDFAVTFLFVRRLTFVAKLFISFFLTFCVGNCFACLDVCLDWSLFDIRLVAGIINLTTLFRPLAWFLWTFFADFRQLLDLLQDCLLLLDFSLKRECSKVAPRLFVFLTNCFF